MTTPLSSPLCEAILTLKYEYRTTPLHVYVNDKFIEPADVDETMQGPLIEVHFELHRFFIPQRLRFLNGTKQIIHQVKLPLICLTNKRTLASIQLSIQHWNNSDCNVAFRSRPAAGH